MKTPKPVRAWAIANEDGKFAPAPYLFIKTTKPREACAAKGERIVRVTIVPDGAASAEVECRRLRKLLQKCKRTLCREVGVGFNKCNTPEKRAACMWRDEHRLHDEIDAALARKGRRNG